MPLTPQEQRELDELELQELESEESKSVTPEPTSTLQSALEGAGQTATLGYLPQIEAGAQLASNKLAKFLGRPSSEESYVNLRDANIARHTQQAKEHPIASTAGKAAGILATLGLGPSAAAVKGAGLGSALLQGAKAGALTGAIYNPGDEKGVVDPLQLGDRAINSVVGAGVGAAGAGIGEGVNKLVKRGQMIDRVKDSANLSSSVKEEINQALSALHEKEIAPQAAKLKEFLQGKEVQFNPDRISEVFPNLAKKLIEKSSVEGAETPMVGMSANRALQLRQALDKAADYKPAGMFSPSTPKNIDAKSAADILRGKISELGPDVDSINKRIGAAAAASHSLRRSSNRSPITSITAQPGTDKASLVDLIDKLAGSHLEETASGIKSARESLLNPVNLLKPLEAPNEARKLLLRGGIKAAETADKLPSGVSDVVLKSLFETKR